jgi:tetratricopeptide (TPR) repeat protein
MHYSEGCTYHENGDLDGAISCYERGLECDEENGSCGHNLATAYFQKGDIEKAWKTEIRVFKYIPPSDCPSAMAFLKELFNRLNEKHRFLENQMTTSQVISVLGEPIMKRNSKDFTILLYGTISMKFKNDKLSKIDF